MRIHHLNCGTHCPIGGCVIDGTSRGLFADIPTHCLLVETSVGLVLVDTGYGLQDVRHPHERLPWLWSAILNVRLKEADTALRQVEALGYGARDVRHIVLTHLDFDHAGGIEDFPEARVHVLAAEKRAAGQRAGFVGAQRYRPAMWDDVSDWRAYAPQGDDWLGFEAVRQLDGLPPEILMVPLRGHTEGHAGVAVQTDTGWLLHAGDAYLHHSQMADGRGNTPGLRAYQHIMDSDRPARRRNQQRLRDLCATHGERVQVFCSHDRVELRKLQDASRQFCHISTRSMEGAVS